MDIYEEAAEAIAELEAWPSEANARLADLLRRLSRQSKSNALLEPFSSGLPMHIEAQAICLWLKQREHREEEAGKRAADFIQRQERDRLAVGKLADETADALAKSNALLVEAESALRPFAKLADSKPIKRDDGLPPKDDEAFDYAWGNMQWGWLRKARAILSQIEQSKC